MDNIWLQLFTVLLGASILKYVILMPLAHVFIDIGALVICYFVLRKYPYIDIKKSMRFLAMLTLVAILIDLGYLSGLLGNILILAVLAWVIFRRNGGNGGGRKKPSLRHKWHK